jgi:hypothetical protein
MYSYYFDNEFYHGMHLPIVWITTNSIFYLIYGKHESPPNLNQPSSYVLYVLLSQEGRGFQHVFLVNIRLTVVIRMFE